MDAAPGEEGELSLRGSRRPSRPSMVWKEPQCWAQRFSDLIEPSAQRIIIEVGIPLGGLDLRVAEQPADPRRRHPA